MVGVSELVASDGVIFRLISLDMLSTHHSSNDDSAYRLIKPNQSDVELTPVEHYFNITGQVSTFILLILAGVVVAILKLKHV